MMNNQNQPIRLDIGDEIGFVTLAQNVDDNDRVIYFPVVEITMCDGERAYRYQYPDGNISGVAIKESSLNHYSIRINRADANKHADLGICLTERKSEFREALRRGMNNEIEVFAGWDRDTFFVVNQTNQTEYKVEFETVDGKVFAQCECKDFQYRKRVCKHISEVLQEQFFGMKLAV